MGHEYSTPALWFPPGPWSRRLGETAHRPQHPLGRGQWLVGAGLAPSRYVASQGTALGRAGRVHVAQDEADPGTIWVGGDSVTCIEGSVAL